MRHVTQARARGRINFAITRHTRGEEEGEYGRGAGGAGGGGGGGGNRLKRVLIDGRMNECISFCGICMSPSRTVATRAGGRARRGAGGHQKETIEQRSNNSVP